MSDDRLEEARSSIRRWAGRPPAVSAGHARTRVLARLETTVDPGSPAWLTASWVAAGLALALLLGALWQPGVSVQTDRGEPVVPRHQSTVVYELSSGTTLYLTLTNSPEAGLERLGSGPGGET